MTITKFAHCCLLIEESSVRILTDPGKYSTRQNSLTNIDIILITHDHADHLDVDSLKKLVRNNPVTTIITNSAVGATLNKEDIAYRILEDKQTITLKGIVLEGIGKDHALMHASIAPTANTGYMIADRFFYPGDALTIPTKPVKILALPVGGPWMKIAEGVDYALAVKPNVCFPVHDGGLVTPGSAHRVPAQVLAANGIAFTVLETEKEYTF